jgi:hypothetical protein
MTKSIRYPKGYHPRPGVTKIAVAYPDHLFKVIVERAKRENKTFNAMAVELTIVGDFDLSESDALEPPKQSKRAASQSRDIAT